MSLDYRLVLDTLADAVVAADPDGRIVYVNAAAERLLRCGAAQLVGEPLKRIVPPRLHAAHDAGFARYLATRTPRLIGRPIRLPALRADGTEVEVELILSVFPTPGGEMVAASLRDVSQRIELERQIAVTACLRATAEAAARLTSGLALGQVLEIATETLVRDFGGTAAQVWLHDTAAGRLALRASAGAPAPEPVRLPIWLEAVCLDRAPFLGSPSGDGADAIVPAGTAVAAFPLLIPGEPTGVLVHATPQALTDEVVEALRSFAAIVAASLNAARLFGYAQAARADAEDAARRLAAEHVTARALAEASTIEEASARIIRAICESLDWALGAVWTVDDAAGLLRLRQMWHAPGLSVPEFEELSRRLEYRREIGLPGQVWASGEPVWIPDVVTDANFPRAPAAAREGLHGAFGFPIRVGRTVVGVIEFFSREIRAPDEHLLRMLTSIGSQIGQFIERTRGEEERARLYVEAQDANRAKDDFLANISHELRTPLTAMLGWARMLRSGRLDDEAVARALEVIERNTEAQAQLIEDLLDISRITSGKLRLDVQPVDLVHVIEGAIHTVTPAADAKSIRVQTLLDPAAGTVTGDPGRLQQVVWNLLSNAIKFTPRGGRVQLRLERLDSRGEIAVADTGRGIAPEFLPHVFDRFRQADTASGRAHGGLGLGLAIVRHLVELHGGAVRAASEGTDRGATFTVSLPIAPTRADASEARVHPTGRSRVPFERAPNLDGVRVLVVDDEPDTRALLARILRECGATVATVASAAEALAAFEGGPPDVLVTDIGMPGEDGYALIRKIRARGPQHGGRVPAAALTAYARVEDRMRALSAGFQLHVPKPVEPAELATVVATLAGRTSAA